MAISEEVAAQILRYYHVEKWRVGTISRILGVHHSTVKRVLHQTGVPRKKVLSSSIIDPYLPFIIEKLNQFPSLTAARLYEMVCERGYPGSKDHFRHLIALHRPKQMAEAYLRLRTLPGEESQVDWGHFGYQTIGKAKRPLMAFVMVLSYSRKIFLQFYLNQQTANFLRGHEAAFASFDGVPKVCLYDNLKSAVLERQGDAIRFNPTLLAFSAHYRFEPRPVAVARGNEKGRVERAIRYVRDNFFAGREFKDIDDLNRQAMLWCEGVAADRPCPEERSKTVREVFEEERPNLIALPSNSFSTDEQINVNVGKTPYIRFDLNDYSVPHKYVRHTLALRASLTRVTIFDGADVIARHPRSYDKGQQIEDERHIQDLTTQKKKARQHRGIHRLTYAIPCAEDFLKQAAQKNYHMATTCRALLQLLDDYGAVELEKAMNEAIEKNVPHPNTIRIYLQKQREQQNLPPPIPLDLPKDKRIQNQVVRTHDLKNYDQLQHSNKTEGASDE